MPYLNDEEVIKEFKEKFIGIDFWQQFSSGTKSGELIQPFLDFLLIQRQEDREVLTEMMIKKLKSHYRCAKCDGARNRQHSLSCTAIADAVSLICNSGKSRQN